MKIPMLLRSARAAQRSEAREVCRITPLARTQSERRRRLALATGFRLLRLSGINRIAAQGSVAGRAGGQAQMAEDYDNHRRIFDGGPSTKLRTGPSTKAQAMIFKPPPQFGQWSTSISKTRLLWRTGDDFTTQLCVRREHAMEAKNSKMDVDPSSAEELQSLLKEVMTQPKEVIEKVRKLLGN
jgi:hypothetical protein